MNEYTAIKRKNPHTKPEINHIQTTHKNQKLFSLKYE